MNIKKGDLVKVKVWEKKDMRWTVATDFREGVDFGQGTLFCYCLEEESEMYFHESEIEQVVNAEPTGQFLKVLSQKEKVAYATYYVKEAGSMLTDIEKPSHTDTKSIPVPFKINLGNGSTLTTVASKNFTDQNGVPVKNLSRYTSEEMDGWKKTQELFDPFEDQTPYPLDFDNFVYGDVEQCYDEERDYLVINCVDDFIEHMMTTR